MLAATTAAVGPCTLVRWARARTQVLVSLRAQSWRRRRGAALDSPVAARPCDSKWPQRRTLSASWKLPGRFIFHYFLLFTWFPAKTSSNIISWFPSLVFLLKQWFPAKTSSNDFLWFPSFVFKGFRIAAAPPVSN